MPGKYRRHIDRLDEWHFYPDCPGWPEVNYLEQSEPPDPEDLCPTCVELDSPETRGRRA
jgi:hypothetical protein